MFWSTLFGLVAVFSLANGAGEGEWGYLNDGVSSWGSVNSDCSGSSQSPIDITDDNTELNETLYNATFNFGSYSSTSDTWTAINYGKTVAVIFDAAGTLRTLSGGGLDGTYKALQFHVHFGDSDGDGSEHTFNGMQTPMELHIVHIRDTYNNISTALAANDDSALAVLGMMFEIGSANPALASFLAVKDSIMYPDNSTNVPAFSLEDLLPSNKRFFARYQGSLTTPPCTQAVAWTVFGETLSMSQDQYNDFLMFKSDEDGLEYQRNIFRPPQPLNGRTVQVSAEWPEGTSGTAHVTVTLSVLLLAVLAYFTH